MGIGCFSNSDPRDLNLGGLDKLGWALLTSSLYHSEISGLPNFWAEGHLIFQHRTVIIMSIYCVLTTCQALCQGLYGHFLTQSS